MESYDIRLKENFKLFISGPSTGCPEKTASLENKYPLLKNYRAQIKLYNTLRIVLHVQKYVSQNGQNISKVLYSLFWAL